MARDDIPVQRWHNKGPRKVNIRPGIADLATMSPVGETVSVSMRLHESAEAKAKPQEVMQALLGLDDDQLRGLRIYKQETFARMLQHPLYPDNVRASPVHPQQTASLKRAA